jgi:hypothetical protein
MEENLVQDLFQNYVSDLTKMRDEFHDELTATATELSKAICEYSRRGEAALTSFMEQVAARGEALEAAAAARFNLFRGLSADGGPCDEKIAAVAEQAVADSFESVEDRKHRPAIALVKSEPAA